MKVKSLFLLVFVCLGSYSVNAQVDKMKSAEETARRLDELDGKSTPQRRANGENSSRYEYPDNNRTTEENDAIREQWEYLFEAQMAYFKDGMDKFNTPELRCIFIMVIYIDLYESVVKSTNETSEIEAKCDGYALQLMALTASTSIMYCPESFLNLIPLEQHRIYHEDLVPILENVDDNKLVADWLKKFEKITGPVFPVGHLDGGVLPELFERYFKPEYFINQLLFIQRHMQALDCPE